MGNEIRTPVLPESIQDATVLSWHKAVGDVVTRDEILVELETDKVILEVPATKDGLLKEIVAPTGTKVISEAIIAILDDATSQSKNTKGGGADIQDIPVTSNDVSGQASSQEKVTSKQPVIDSINDKKSNTRNITPAVRRVLANNTINLEQIIGTGRNGRITRQDAHSAINTSSSDDIRSVTTVPMSRMRTKIAERLLHSKNTTAMLTTINEVNMQPIVDIRTQYKEEFIKKHGVKLGFMSFFTKAVIHALALFPNLNASIDGNNILYHNYYDIGIAVSSERGLVVPVLRNVEELNMADIEKSIIDFANKIKDNKINLTELQGGTFTITNGGVFGSLLSTPIINPPQTAILGMHKIQERPIVENGVIVARPMMYLALSYDHRLIDGKDSVQFLVAVKKYLEDPINFLLGL